MWIEFGPARLQEWCEMTQETGVTQGPLTTEAGAPVADNQNSETAGMAGPVLVWDQLLPERRAPLNRECIPMGVPTPSRRWGSVVHARGAGAHGTFTVTADVTPYTRAAFLSEAGRQTETLLRVSTVAGSRGAADAVRYPRGWALKFCTEEGGYDLVGNNTPVFFIKDAIKFPDFIHTQKRDPYSGSQEADSVWDLGAQPESTHQVTWLFGDRGIPASRGLAGTPPEGVPAALSSLADVPRPGVPQRVARRLDGLRGAGSDPAADDVADRDDAGRLAAVEDDQMAEAAVGHRPGRLLQGPGRGGEHDVVGGVGVDGLRVRVLAQADGVQDVAFGEDADATGVRVVDDRRAHATRGHQGGRLAECVGWADGEDHRAHGVTDEHERCHLLGNRGDSSAIHKCTK